MTIKQIFKKLILLFFSKKCLRKIINFRFFFQYKKAKEKFLLSTPSINHLSIDDLRKMQLEFKYPPEYGYSDEILNIRGKKRADYLLKLLPEKIESALELGCWDGMVSYHLMKNKTHAVGIDFRDEGFDKRALNSGVNLIKMDAADLKFEDSSFDLVFSYDAFEHFSNPEHVLKEMYRVVKPKGYIYLDFGPLFMSPMGLHAYRQITVPYCQFLFSKDTLQEFLKEKKLEPLDFNHCNGWSRNQFRDLWKKYKEKLIPLEYIERNTYSHLDIIKKYAPIFKNKTDDFDNLICESIEVLFQKT